MIMVRTQDISKLNEFGSANIRIEEQKIILVRFIDNFAVSECDHWE
jgi:hypothetical protein